MSLSFNEQQFTEQVVNFHYFAGHLPYQPTHRNQRKNSAFLWNNKNTKKYERTVSEANCARVLVLMLCMAPLLAVATLKPSLGPVTGSTVITITGPNLGVGMDEGLAMACLFMGEVVIQVSPYRY